MSLQPNIAASTVLDRPLWYVGSSPPSPTQADSLPEQTPSTLPSPPQPVSIRCPAPPLFALIIGINKYLSRKFPDLHDAVADADAVNIFLQETLRVPEHRIKNLRNEGAMRAAIEEAIKGLGDDPEIKKDDPILIYYAGYGAKANAPSGWPSANGKIQMLVPYDFILDGSSDSRRGQGILDITLSRLLKGIADKKSDNITVILDCCYSGSDTRYDPTSAIRGIYLPETYAVARDLLDGIEFGAQGSDDAKGFEETAPSSHVLLSACRADQKAEEKDGHGVFTWALLSMLRKSDVAKLTYEDVITNLPFLRTQDPQCEGVHQYRCLFDSKAGRVQLKSYAIRASSDSPSQYVLEAGEAHGITKNTEFIVFADRTMTSELGTVIASSTTAFTTTCDFSARGNETPFRLVDCGYALPTRVGEKQDIFLCVKPNTKLWGVYSPMKKKMQSDKARKWQFHEVESNNDRLDLVIALDGDVVHFEIMDKVCRLHGLTRMPFEVKIDDLDTVYGILRRVAEFYWNLHRSCRGNPLAGKVTLECMKLKGTGKFTYDSQEGFEADGDNLNIGGVISVDVDENAIYGLKISNTTSVPLYVSLFYFDVSVLRIVSYYPPKNAEGGAADVSLPPGGSFTIKCGASGTVSHMFNP
ncbi:caspase domain-containing protein [Armillaria fumosa]|nr:caspase domain-containing protein [Armillaria fumosa]